MAASPSTAATGGLCYTVGHGNRSLDELIGLLRAAGVATLVDLRTRPASRRHPQFNGDSLRHATTTSGLGYHWAGPELGGLRRLAPDSPNSALPDGLRGFADYMATPAFETALARLIERARRAPIAMLCAERIPEQCHRALISDALLLAGLRVVHLLTPDQQREHRLSPARRGGGGPPIYDRGSNGELDLGGAA